jgi:hypothetical protein
MEERPEDRIEEEQDVEGHKHHRTNVGKANVGQNIGKDEGDDVEAHSNVGAPQVGGAPQVSHDDDEGDDVEAHSNVGAPQVGGAPQVSHDDDEDDDVEAHQNFGAPQVGG